MSNLATVKAMYEAFNRGDIPYILDRVADDVEWEKWKDNYAQKAGVPYLRAQTGRQGVADFFAAVEDLGITNIEILSMMEGDHQVAVEVYVESAKVNDEEMHLFTFNDEGKITRFRHYLDTAKQIAANEKSQASSAA
jgi:ketosteroid isomerase-like protein